MAPLNCYKQVSVPLIQKGNEKWAVFQQTTCTCYGLGRNSPYRFTCLNTWTLAGGTFFKAVKPLGLGPHRANVSHCPQGFEGYCTARPCYCCPTWPPDMPTSQPHTDGSKQGCHHHCASSAMMGLHTSETVNPKTAFLPKLLLTGILSQPDRKVMKKLRKHVSCICTHREKVI